MSRFFDVTRAGRGDGPAPAGAGAGPSSSVRIYRYWPVFVAVSIARPDSLPLPLISVRM
ncbi:hypothetical protein SAMN05660485_01033 [Blastococcus fimeti]|nr:hypothetical protein SAMN05660485_01033 [Blastococcus fimeti]